MGTHKHVLSRGTLLYTGFGMSDVGIGVFDMPNSYGYDILSILICVWGVLEVTKNN